MLSPAGVVKRPDENDFRTRRYQNGRGPPRFVRYVATKIWANKWSPFGIMRGLGGCAGKKLIKGYMNKRMPMLSPEEAENMQTYL